MPKGFGKLAAGALLALMGLAACSRIAPLVASPTAKSIAPGAYWVSGGVSNSGFVVGDKGVIVIDAQTFVRNGKAQLAEIAKVTSKPVTTVILTHSDPDHINGLPAFARGLTIIAQENAKSHIARVITDPKSNGLKPPPEIREYLPTRTVRGTEELTLQGVRMVLIHTAPAHTDGDLIVYLPSLKLVYAGDLLTPAIGPYPGIHLEKHGTSAGWIASVEAMLALDAEIFVGGHGDPLTRAQVAVRLKAAKQRRTQIVDMIARGMSLAELKRALDDKPLPGVASRFPTFVETTFQELAPQ